MADDNRSPFQAANAPPPDDSGNDPLTAALAMLLSGGNALTGGYAAKLTGHEQALADLVNAHPDAAALGDILATILPLGAGAKVAGEARFAGGAGKAIGMAGAGAGLGALAMMPADAQAQGAPDQGRAVLEKALKDLTDERAQLRANPKTMSGPPGALSARLGELGPLIDTATDKLSKYQAPVTADDKLRLDKQAFDQNRDQANTHLLERLLGLGGGALAGGIGGAFINKAMRTSTAAKAAEFESLAESIKKGTAGRGSAKNLAGTTAGDRAIEEVNQAYKLAGSDSPFQRAGGGAMETDVAGGGMFGGGPKRATVDGSQLFDNPKYSAMAGDTALPRALMGEGAASTLLGMGADKMATRALGAGDDGVVPDDWRNALAISGPVSIGAGGAFKLARTLGNNGAVKASAASQAAVNAGRTRMERDIAGQTPQGMDALLAKAKDLNSHAAAMVTENAKPGLATATAEADLKAQQARGAQAEQLRAQAEAAAANPVVKQPSGGSFASGTAESAAIRSGRADKLKAMAADPSHPVHDDFADLVGQHGVTDLSAKLPRGFIPDMRGLMETHGIPVGTGNRGVQLAAAQLGEYRANGRFPLVMQEHAKDLIAQAQRTRSNLDDPGVTDWLRSELAGKAAEYGQQLNARQISTIVRRARES